MSEPLASILRTLAWGKLPKEVPANCECRDEIVSLVGTFEGIQRLALNMSRGELRELSTVPGPVVGSLKALQASLRHLTWQTQRIAAGDYSQRTDFLGEFSTAFNEMVRLLSERKKMEVQLRQSQKLEAVGRLAAGLAHEINTPAQFMGDSLAFVRDGLGDMIRVLEKYRALVQAEGSTVARQGASAAEKEVDLPFLLEKMPEAIEQAVEGLERVAAIVRSMKEFADPDHAEMRYIDLNHAVESILVVAKHEYGTLADLDVDLGQLPMVLCHLSAVNEAILNILVNAAQAIRQKIGETGGRGRIGIRTWADEASVYVSIADTGDGIPEDIREHIYDPFFTTKDVGQGRGQGLTVARAILVEQHHGDLSFVSELGKGTTFTLRLPIAGNASAA